MKPCNSCLVLATFIACILAGCAVVPVPALPKGTLYRIEANLESMVDSRATKTVVIEQIGKPVKYRKTSMSYRACRKPFGVGWGLVVLGSSGQLSGYAPPKRKSDCFELLLNFNRDGYLASYEELPWQADINILQEDMMLKEFANEGDPIAAQLWRQAAPGANLPGVSIYKEAGVYCPNADLGHADAQLRIAMIYDHGAFRKKVNPVRAWVWYSLASQNGDEAAMTRLTSLSNELTPEQLEEAKRQFVIWRPGMCMHELLSDD